MGGTDRNGLAGPGRASAGMPYVLSSRNLQSREPTDISLLPRQTPTSNKPHSPPGTTPTTSTSRNTRLSATKTRSTPKGKACPNSSTTRRW